ncbi:hypothetical protein [Hyunsoonleella ulvae]|uniref:hypothetical protein n=1 Tax=Hyunsoonleella ulvae TaxID=2799948 RepID=UPI00193A18F0|nr:hypothetical protein [Hyunsoonleella ulvae]
MSKRLRPLVLVFCGWITLIMMLFVPIGGGGVSLILVLSVPILVVMGVLFGVSYWYLDKKSNNKTLKTVIFYIMIIVLLGLAFMYYPY